MSESRPSFLLVDGTNIMHAWSDLSEMRRRRPEDARNELIRRLEAYRDFSEDRVVVVFDGRGTATVEAERSDGLQVFFSGEGKTADDVIERLATKYAGKFEIAVATDDRAEQDLVVGVGGSAMSSSILRERIEQAERRMREWIDRHRKRR